LPAENSCGLPRMDRQRLINLIAAIAAITVFGFALGLMFPLLSLIMEKDGIAPNVISPSASAEVMFRIAGSADEVLRTAKQVEPAVAVEEVLRVPMVRLHTIADLPAAVFPFTTDIPFLDRWGTPILFGPGSFLVAHTAEEHLAIDEMDAAIAAYERIAASLMAVRA